MKWNIYPTLNLVKIVFHTPFFFGGLKFWLTLSFTKEIVKSNKPFMTSPRSRLAHSLYQHFCLISNSIISFLWRLWFLDKHGLSIKESFHVQKNWDLRISSKGNITYNQIIELLSNKTQWLSLCCEKVTFLQSH